MERSAGRGKDLRNIAKRDDAHTIASVVYRAGRALQKGCNLPRLVNLDVRTVGQVNFQGLERCSISQGNDLGWVHDDFPLWPTDRFCLKPSMSTFRSFYHRLTP